MPQRNPADLLRSIALLAARLNGGSTVQEGVLTLLAVTLTLGLYGAAGFAAWAVLSQ